MPKTIAQIVDQLNTAIAAGKTITFHSDFVEVDFPVSGAFVLEDEDGNDYMMMDTGPFGCIAVMPPHYSCFRGIQLEM
jgi:hypothetical protein